MDIEILGAAVGLAAAVAGAVGLEIGRKTAPLPPVQTVTYSPALTSVSGDEGHVHEGTTATTSGWACSCGKHLHVFFKEIEGEAEKVCECGIKGIGKAWS